MSEPDWSWLEAQSGSPAKGWHLNLARSSSWCACWQDGMGARVYLLRTDLKYVAADNSGWRDGVYESFAEAAARLARGNQRSEKTDG